MARIRSNQVNSETRPAQKPHSTTACATVRTNKPVPPPKYALIKGNRYPISPVLDTLFYFFSERHRIHQRRIAGDPAPWTEDHILGTFPFTNVFRVYDRTTQYILQHVVREGPQDLRESCFRVMLFRAFNKIETWELLEDRLGQLTWADFDVREYEAILLEAQAEGPLYSPAYIMPAPKLGAQANASNHLRLIELMMEMGLPDLLTQVRHMRDAHGRICLFPSMGDFTGMQLLLDLNLLPHFTFNEDEWVALGPGATECIRKIFGPSIRGSESDALNWLHSTQHEHFARLGIRGDRIPRLHKLRPGGVTKVDLEHTLCEVEKYSRGRFPNIKGKKTKVGKHIFVPKRKSLTAEVPAHWLTHRRANAPTYPRPPPVAGGDSEEEYEVSHIVSENSSGKMFLTRWVGWGPEDDSWLKESELMENAAELVDEWYALKEKIRDLVAHYQAMGNRYKPLVVSSRTRRSVR